MADADKRRELMVDIQTILQDSGVIIQSYWRSLFHHSVPELKNYTMHPAYELELQDVWLDA